MTAASDRTVHILISGRVQGVGFRAWMRGEAQRLGLAGWVRNTQDGHVEAVLCGLSGDVKTMLESCQDGPRWARVDNVEQHPAKAFSETGFTVQSTR